MSNVETRSRLKSIDNVFLFVPNIIGYTRIILASLSLYYMPWHPKVCATLYCISCLLDAVDGNAARYFDQCSKFGAVLDMVTDRCTTSCLLCFLSLQYTEWTILFQFLVSLDFSSHYMHMYSSMTAGSTSHKKLSESDYKFLHLYYNSSTVLFIMCAGNELFFVTLYFLKFLKEPVSKKVSLIWDLIVAWYILLVVSGVICFAKQFINVVQIVNASKVLANVDKEERQKALSAKEQ
ncbi:phosphatidylinositol synthase [Zychaea mexicana]|uniref:phosphatidylinositol synthase n=1 Tax=Zychaea mexicana TaxID=64656 RepID=UPI0022FEBD0C|nr:phosphatidylinositol synthase [Zychaea mexicana]KAI9489828.1 phosphatidylinositol synthase [Zychaea mexicana]